MRQGTYIAESTESLIRKAEQILGGTPVLDLTNPQFPTYTPAEGHIRSLAGSCHSITVRNVINVTDNSIIVCAGPAIGTCGAIPATCPPPLSPTTDYVNMVATVNALVAQNGVEITFKYLLDDVPTTTAVIVNLSAGNNTVYAFALNTLYPVGTKLDLYSAEVTSY